jgi:hypothetical protein
MEAIPDSCQPVIVDFHLVGEIQPSPFTPEKAPDIQARRCAISRELWKDN